MSGGGIGTPFDLPADWQTLHVPSREIEFAWGPAGGGLAELGAIELVIAAGPGGAGTVWIGDLRIEDRTYRGTPQVRASRHGLSCAVEPHGRMVPRRTQRHFPPNGVRRLPLSSSLGRAQCRTRCWHRARREVGDVRWARARRLGCVRPHVDRAAVIPPIVTPRAAVVGVAVGRPDHLHGRALALVELRAAHAAVDSDDQEVLAFNLPRRSSTATFNCAVVAAPGLAKSGQCE